MQACRRRSPSTCTAPEDVREALEELRRAGHELAIFSNGTAGQQALIVREAGIGEFFPSRVSVDDVYEPRRNVWAA